MQYSPAYITSQLPFFFTHTTMGKGLQSNDQATRSKKATVYLRARVNVSWNSQLQSPFLQRGRYPGAHVKSHLQKFRLGKPVGRLWKKSNPPRTSRKTTDLGIQLSDGSGSLKSPLVSNVYIEGEGEGSEDEIHYENNQMQVFKSDDEPVENDQIQGGRHHSMVAPENACVTDNPAELKTRDEVSVPALQPTSAARDEIIFGSGSFGDPSFR